MPIPVGPEAADRLKGAWGDHFLQRQGRAACRVAGWLSPMMPRLRALLLSAAPLPRAPQPYLPIVDQAGSWRLFAEIARNHNPKPFKQIKADQKTLKAATRQSERVKDAGH